MKKIKNRLNKVNLVCEIKEYNTDHFVAENNNELFKLNIPNWVKTEKIHELKSIELGSLIAAQCELLIKNNEVQIFMHKFEYIDK